jgi:inward rectifier potassium channel
MIFATIYYAQGPGALNANVSDIEYGRFAQCVFFSSQTLTTVGFGALAPRSQAANLTAALEALVGLLGFAVATGLLFGRVARPSARIGFSDRALIAPYQDATSFQFRMVNRRANSLIEPTCTLMLMTVDRSTGDLRREFQILRLERDKVMLFPLTWTVVHPIDRESPLYGKSADDLKELQAEFLVLIKAWDETFSQTVHQRYSYRFNEVVWGGRYKQSFGIDAEGSIEVHVNRVGEHEIKELPRLRLQEPE